MEKKKIIIAVIAISLFIVIAIGAVYAFTDVFKSPKELFYKYLAQNIQTLEEFNYDEVLNDYKNMSEKSYITTGEISLDISSEDTQIQEISNEINKMKIKTEEKNMPKESKSYKDVKLDYDNNNLIQASIIKNNEIYGIKSDILHEKYISVENNNLKQLAQKLGIDENSIPDKFEQVNIYDLLYISKEDRDKITGNYKEILDKELPKNKYKVEKNVEVEINNQKTKANAYILKVDEKETINLIIKLLEKLKEDDLTLDLITEKVNKANINSIIDEDKKLSKDKIQQKIEETLENLKEDLEDADEDELTIKVYEENGKTIKTEILVNEDIIMLEKYKDNNENYIVIKLQEDGSQTFSIITKYIEKEENETKTVTGNVTIKEEYSEDISFDFEIATKGKIGTRESQTNANISFDVEDTKIKIQINQTIDFSQKIEIEDLDENNSIKINSMEENEIQNLYKQIYTNIQEQMNKKLKDEKLAGLINIILGTNEEKPHYDLDYNV